MRKFSLSNAEDIIRESTHLSITLKTNWIGFQVFYFLLAFLALKNIFRKLCFIVKKINKQIQQQPFQQSIALQKRPTTLHYKLQQQCLLVIRRNVKFHQLLVLGIIINNIHKGKDVQRLVLLLIKLR